MTLLYILLGLAAVLLLARTVFSTRRTDFRRSADADRDDALRLLRMRLAEGTISPDEYERLRRVVAAPTIDGNR
jgi:putative membrane protein